MMRLMRTGSPVCMPAQVSFCIDYEKRPFLAFLDWSDNEQKHWLNYSFTTENLFMLSRVSRWYQIFHLISTYWCYMRKKLKTSAGCILQAFLTRLTPVKRLASSSTSLATPHQMYFINKCFSLINTDHIKISAYRIHVNRRCRSLWACIKTLQI